MTVQALKAEVAITLAIIAAAITPTDPSCQ